MPQTALLETRATLAISGADAEAFLQGLITNDVEHAKPGEAIFAALLTPQGKILFDFLLLNAGERYLVDCRAEIAADLARRLGFYKLRANVAVQDVSSAWRVAAAWGDDTETLLNTPHGFRDPRLGALGSRAFVEVDRGLNADALQADYDAYRIALGVPEGGADYTYGGTFPHEACFDLLHGVDFRKGCFIGQEVVSRMQHRGTARTRVVCVVGEGPLEAGADITADGFAIGKLGSVAGAKGIALARIDRVANAIATGETLFAAGVRVDIAVPEWATYSLAQTPAGADA
jgi:hypothetical protein